MDEWGFLGNFRYLIHDRDTKFTDSFRAIVKSGHVDPLKLPARASLRRALREYLTHFHQERNHRGKGNVLLFPTATKAVNDVDGSVGCKERLGGLLKYYHREAA